MFGDSCIITVPNALKMMTADPIDKMIMKKTKGNEKLEDRGRSEAQVGVPTSDAHQVQQIKAPGMLDERAAAIVWER